MIKINSLFKINMDMIKSFKGTFVNRKIPIYQLRVT